MAVKGKADAKGKKAPKKHPAKKKGEYYKVEGESLKRKKTCPKCGAGVFMAGHKNRNHCGNCGYTEFK